jgi:hypothetical protein
MWAFLKELGLWVMTHIVWDKLCDFIHFNVNIYMGFPRGTRPWLMTHIVRDRLCDFIHFKVKIYVGFPRCTRLPRGTKPCLMTQTGSHFTYLHIAQSWFFLFFWAISIVLSIKCDHLYQLGLHVAMHYQWRFSFLLCSHMIINYSSLFMSMSNFLLININIMDTKRHMLICFFISMLVGKENRKIIINYFF